MIRVAIIEDHPSIRMGQYKYLDAQPDMTIVVVADSVEDFQNQISESTAIDVVVSDIGLPGASGIEGVQWIRKKLPDTQVIMVSVYTDTDNIYKALCAGAVGYLAKNTPLDEIAEGVRTTMQGGSPMTPSIARKVIHHFAPQKSAQRETLSAKEQQVVNCIVEGLSYKLVADRLGISLNTVRHHIRSIYKKLEINSKAELMRISNL